MIFSSEHILTVFPWCLRYLRTIWNSSSPEAVKESPRKYFGIIVYYLGLSLSWTSVLAVPKPTFISASIIRLDINSIAILAFRGLMTTLDSIVYIYGLSDIKYSARSRNKYLGDDFRFELCTNDTFLFISLRNNSQRYSWKIVAFVFSILFLSFIWLHMIAVLIGGAFWVKLC